MRTFHLSSLALLVSLSAAAQANAQVLITELQPNPTGADEGEWVELQNTSTSAYSLAGWTLSDFQGNPYPFSESTSRWAFPQTASIAPGQVMVVARQATQFHANFPMVRVAYEIEPGNVDDANVPNLVKTGTSSFALANGAIGDGLVLRNSSGVLQDGIEYGTLDRLVPGIPAPLPTMNDGISFTRIRVMHSSNVDFASNLQPSPGVGIMMVGGPLIANVRSGPRLVQFGDTFTITASVSDPDGVNLVEAYLDTASSTVGDALADYEAITMTSSGGAYRFSALVNDLSATLGFNEPMSFHERFVRFFVRAEDTNGEASTSPDGAVESSDNAHYLPTYIQNVLPRMPSAISEVRTEGSGGPRYKNFGVHVVGTALVSPDLMSPGQYELSIQDASGSAIAVFSTDGTGFPMVAPGDVVDVTGVLTSFRGLTEISRPLTVTALGQTAPVVTATRTIAAILAEGNALEGQLIHVTDVDYSATIHPTNWPSDPNQAGTWNVPVSDGTGELDVRVTSSCDLFGAPSPQFGFHVTGILVEFNGRWELLPRSAADVFAKPEPPMPDAGMVADSGNQGGNDSGGQPGADAGVHAADSGNGGNPMEDKGGCGCSAGSPSGLGAPGLLGLGLLAMYLRARRRR
ncbi:MAG: lamin tail domain-containing protein [Myxococcota bacterium]